MITSTLATPLGGTTRSGHDGSLTLIGACCSVVLFQNVIQLRDQPTLGRQSHAAPRVINTGVTPIMARNRSVQE